MPAGRSRTHVVIRAARTIGNTEAGALRVTTREARSLARGSFRLVRAATLEEARTGVVQASSTDNQDGAA